MDYLNNPSKNKKKKNAVSMLTGNGGKSLFKPPNNLKMK